jgi:hypothetical protein
VLGWFALRGRAVHVVGAAAIFLALGVHPVFGSPWTWVFLVAIGVLFLLDPPARAEEAVPATEPGAGEDVLDAGEPAAG